MGSVRAVTGIRLRKCEVSIGAPKTTLEPLGPEQGVGEVDKKASCDDAGEPIFEDHGTCLFRYDRRPRLRPGPQELVQPTLGFREGSGGVLIGIS